MLTVSREQMAAVARNVDDELVEAVARHVTEFFAEEAAALGGPGLRDLIGHARRRAARYGLVGRRDVFLFVDLAVAFGADFDADPALPWVEEALSDPALPTPSARLDAVHEALVALARGEG